MSTTIAVDHPAVTYGLSPYNWQRNGSASIRTVNSGAYLKLNFTGTSIGITVNVSAMSSAGYGAGIYPVLKYTIDGVSATRQFTSSDTTITLSSGLPDTSHNLLLETIAFDEGGTSDRWNTPIMSLIITALILDDFKTVTSGALRNGGYMLALGDSITEGAVTISALGSLQYAQVGDATRSYVYILAAALNLELGNCSFSGEGWTTGVSNVPGLTTSYNLLWSGVSRPFGIAPNVVMVNMGTNGSVIAATVTTFLTNLRSACGAGARIYVIIPFNQSNVSPITTGFNDYVSANPADKQIVLINRGATAANIVTNNSFDTVHPNTQGQILLAADLLPFISSPLKAGTPPGGYSGF